MLALTEDAVAAVNTILASAELPEGSGMRISRVPHEEASPDSGSPDMELRLSLVSEPEEGDQAVGEEPVYVDPEAAEVLDDKLLDAEIVDNQVRFMVGMQA